MFLNKCESFVISLIPPLFYNQYIKVKSFLNKKENNNKTQNIWEGIYNHWREVPVKSKSFENFDGTIWADIIYQHTLDIKNKLENYQSVPSGVDEEHSFLPLLVSLIAGTKVRILDFGGGCGEDYLYLNKSVGNNQIIEYFIVENESVKQKSEALFREKNNITFFNELPKELPDLDIIYSNSTLQYIENYQSLLNQLCKYKSKYILFTRLSAGNFQTYATLQVNMKDMQMAYLFININEIIDIMNKNNYQLIFHGVLKQEYNQDNFLEEYRMKQACNLLFKLKN
jgi:putative methyltransferase (TIGR04325 family)